MHGVVQLLASQQDYAWFIAALVWLAVASIWWRGRKREAWAWVPWSAGAGLLAAVIEMAAQSARAQEIPAQPFHPWADTALGLAGALQAIGWAWVCALGVHGGR
jgi:hypothetical protein